MATEKCSWRSLRSVAVIALLLVGACSRTTEPDSQSGETHFLAACGSACGAGLICSGGVCTQPCQQASECGGLAEDAVCTASSPSSQAIDLMRVCDVTCNAKSECEALGTGFDCMDGHCRAGDTSAKCTATPTKLLDAQDLLVGGDVGIFVAMDLAVNATDLFVGVSYGENRGAVLRVPIRGGRPALVAPIDGSEVALLLVGDSVVIAQSRYDGSGEVVRIDLQGGGRTVLASGRIPASTLSGPPGGLATDGKNVYFAAEDGTKSVSLTGGAVTTLTTHTGALAVAGANLLIADSSAEAVFSLPIAAGGPVTTLAASLGGHLGPVLSCGPDICWGSAVLAHPPLAIQLAPEPAQSGTGVIMRLGPDGVPATLSEGVYFAYHMVFDGSDFFATIAGDAPAGVLARIASTGGVPDVMGSGLGLAIDDECLYSGDVTQGVYSVAKTYRGTLPP